MSSDPKYFEIQKLCPESVTGNVNVQGKFGSFIQTLFRIQRLPSLSRIFQLEKRIICSRTSASET